LTNWNAEGRFQGRRDIPLNETGREQARRNGKALSIELGKAEEFNFLCSPLGRARETMEIIRSEMGLPPEAYTIDTRLAEASYGDFEGVSIDELKRDEPEAFATRKAHRWTYAPPNGESLQMTLDRVRPLLDDLAQPTVIVAHGAVGRTVRKYLLDLEEKDAGWYRFPQDRIFRFEGGVEALI